ncbi:MAG: hypothetical protein ACREGE_00440 [Candidatus Microsaccharimonas sp.]
MFLGIGLAMLIIGAIIFSAYAVYQADAHRSLTSVSVPEHTDAYIDVKVEGGQVEPESTTTVMEPDVAPLNGAQQSQTNSTNPNVDMRVNGTPVDVPENGSVHKRVTTENGSTSVDVSSQSNTLSDDSRTRSSININFDSSTQVRNETRE